MRKASAVNIKTDRIICVFENLFISKLILRLKIPKSKILLYLNFNSVEFNL